MQSCNHDLICRHGSGLSAASHVGLLDPRHHQVQLSHEQSVTGLHE